MAKLVAHAPQTAKLKTSGFVGQPSGTIEIAENGNFDVKTYARANVQVPEPAGTKVITENGVTDVSTFAEADVQVPQPSGEITLTSQGQHNVAQYATANVSLPMQSKTVTPTTEQQIIEADDGYEGLGEVTVQGYVPPAPIEPKYINFLDDDGTILHAWTEQELQQATELPPLPTEEGWTYQEWTWTLQEIKDNKFPMDVGVSRTPSNGASIRLVFDFMADDSLYAKFQFKAKNDTVNVVWGDGTVDTYTVDSTNYQTIIVEHTYAIASQYTVDVLLVNKTGKISYFVTGWGEYVPSSCMITLLAYGDNFETVEGYAIIRDKSLKRLSLAKTVKNIAGADWINGTMIECICFPRSITTAPRTFYQTPNIKHAILPPSFSMREWFQFFTDQTSLKRFNLPRSLTNIGGRIHSDLLTVIYIPNTITSISAGAFEVCYNLWRIDLSDYSDPNSIPTLQNVNAFKQDNSYLTLQVRNQTMLDAFTSATNWSTYADQFVIGGKFGEVTT